MRVSIPAIGLVMALAGGLSGNALAHDRGGPAYDRGYGHRPPAVVVYPAYRPRRHGWHRNAYRGPRAQRPHYRPRPHENGSRWGIQLFYGDG
jgi:hypothetical protein